MSIWLSYSAYSQYNKCGKQYDYDRVSEVEPPTRDSRHNAIVGSVVQSTFEDFYNEKLWEKSSDVADILTDRAERHFQDFMDNNYINFNDFTSRYESKADPLQEIYDIIPKTIEGIKREKLLGPYARSEKEMKVPFDDDFLYGYVDFIIRKPNDEILLLDGKSSRHREKNVSVEQLYFYTLMFYKEYRTLPDKLGFFYYRFADDPDQTFDWIEVDKYKLMELKNDIKNVLDGIHSKEFEANPDPSHCKWCQWSSICDERQQQKKKNRMKRKMRSSKKEIEVDGNEDEIGFDALD
jgi:CRISPR/Cas system-associated exonuclease Cas4 (RecB family)